MKCQGCGVELIEGPTARDRDRFAAGICGGELCGVQPRAIDLTGTPPSKRDVEEAMQVVKKMIIRGIHTLPPELAIQLPNILRCLQRLSMIEPSHT